MKSNLFSVPNIIETGVHSMRRVLQRSNPLETPGCESQDCLPCQHGRGEGGSCRGCGINYEVECQLCPEGERSLYIGETSRNLFTRSREHWPGTGQEQVHPSCLNTRTVPTIGRLLSKSHCQHQELPDKTVEGSIND